MAQPNKRTTSRRQFLGSAAAVGLGGGLLAACGDDEEAAPAATTTTAAAATTTAAPTTTAAATTTTAASAFSDLPPAKIGFVTPRTGPLAALGETDDFVLGQMRELFGDRIEIIDKDTETDATRAGEVTNELIAEGAHLVLCGGTPDTTIPVAAACDLGETPCLSTLAPWQPHYVNVKGGPPGPEPASVWNHHFFWGIEHLTAVFLDLWAQADVEPIIGALWGGDPDGLAFGDPELGQPPAFIAEGYTIIDDGRFDLGTQDFSAQIASFKDNNVQIVTGVLPPPVFATYQAQALQQGFNPPVVTVAKGLLFSSAIATYPKGDGLSSEIWWTDRYPTTSSLTGQSANELAEAYIAATGRNWEQPLGYGHAVWEVAIDALRRAGTTEKTALNEAIGQTNLDTQVGNVNFSEGPVPQLTTTTLVGGQWVAGDRFPFELFVAVNTFLADHPIDGPLRLIE